MNIQICYNRNMDFDPLLFQKWVQEKFAEWRGIKRVPLAAFARYIGVSAQVMNNWWNGVLKDRPDPKQYQLLIQKFGVEVYDILGIPRPSEADVLAMLPDEVSGELRLALFEIKSSALPKDKETATPEEIEKIRDILVKHLGKYQVTEH